MSKPIVEVDIHTTTITIPEDGDDETAGSVETPFQGLTNRTYNAKGRLDRLAGTRTKLVPLAHCRPPNGMGIVPGVQLLDPLFTSGAAIWAWAANSYQLIVPIDLSTGDILTDVSFFVEHGNAGASGQMNAKVFRDEISTTLPGTNVQLGSTLTFTVGTGYRNQNIAISSNNTFDNALYQFYAMVTGSDLAGTNSDYLHWAKLTYTAHGAP